MLLSCTLNTDTLSDYEASQVLEEFADCIDSDVLSEFVCSQISYEDALNIAMSDDSFTESFMSKDSLFDADYASIASFIEKVPKDMAYYLVYISADSASAMLDELMYYREQGVI